MTDQYHESDTIGEEGGDGPEAAATEKLPEKIGH